MHELVTIRFSHYNEKARWALERFGVPYRERGFMPGFHALGVLRWSLRFGTGKGDRISSPFATPLLITDDARCIRDSSAIVRYVSDTFAGPDASLYFDPDAALLERHYSVKLGPHTRRFAYFHAFTDPTVLTRLADANVGPTQARLFKAIAPYVERGIAKGLDISAEGAARSLELVRGLMNDTSAHLAGRRYLVGDRFSAADLAFATMAAPILCVSPDEGYGAALPPLDETPPAFREVAESLRASPAGQFALRMFREERGHDSSHRPTTRT